MAITLEQIEAEAVRLHERDCGCRQMDEARWLRHASDKLHWDIGQRTESTTRWVRCTFRRQAFRTEVLREVVAERDRQDAKFGWADATGRPVPGSHLPGADLHAKVSVLTEETGEVGHAVLEGDDENLAEELIQVMAVCLAWLESRQEFGR